MKRGKGEWYTEYAKVANAALRFEDLKTGQLFSLRARFHEISSPMVELVLETGCL